MTVSRVDDNGVSTSSNERINAFHCVCGDTHTSCNAQATLGIFTSHRFVFCFGDVFIGNQTHQFAVVVNDRELFNLVLLQNFASSSQVSCCVCRYQIFRGHHFVNGLVEVVLKSEIAVGDDAYKVHIIVYHRDTANVIFSH